VRAFAKSACFGFLSCRRWCSRRFGLSGDIRGQSFGGALTTTLPARGRLFKPLASSLLYW